MFVSWCSDQASMLAHIEKCAAGIEAHSRNELVCQESMPAFENPRLSSAHHAGALSLCSPSSTEHSWMGFTSASSVHAAAPRAHPTGGTLTSISAPQCSCRHTGVSLAWPQAGDPIVCMFWMSLRHVCALETCVANNSTTAQYAWWGLEL